MTASVLIGIVISLAVLGLRSFGFLESLELAAYDLCIRLRPDSSGLHAEPRKERTSASHATLSRHVAPEVAQTIWKQRDQFMDGGRPRSQKFTATVLFTDLSGYTSVSEKMDRQALLEWLNVYMEAMAQLVVNHGGVVDNYIGDSIKRISVCPCREPPKQR